MSYATLENEIRALPESYIEEISQFIVYLKLKDRFAAFENGNSYEAALSAWRNDSKPLFDSAEDAEFMEKAFDSALTREVYKAKEIW